MNSAFQTRCLLICLVMVGLLSVISVHLVRIQVTDRERFVEGSARTFSRREVLPAIRGMIVDRLEEPLARSVPVSSVFVDKKHLFDPKMASYGLAYDEAVANKEWEEMEPKKRRRLINALRGKILSSEDPEIINERHLARAISLLARPLNLRREELRERIVDSPGTYVRIAKDLPGDLADRLRDIIDEERIQGFSFENGLKRVYSSPKMATHLIGFTGEQLNTDETGKISVQTVGKFGVEATMEEYLRGSDGWRLHKRDNRGLVMAGGSKSLQPPRGGLNVQLTLDMRLQAIVEEELDRGLEEMKAPEGAVVMMDPMTGEVLAMASRPHFDLNLRENIATNGLNYAIQSLYEPGSTVKVVATAGALNEGLVNPQTSIYCHNGYYKDGAVVVTDQHPASYLTFEGVLQKSNNIGTYKLGRQLGAERFYRYAAGFGLGQRSGIQLSTESAGMARNTGNAMDFSRATFGYALNLTPLQITRAYCVIAGDGNLRVPQVVKGLIASNGTVIENFEPEIVQQTLRPEVARQMRTALSKVTELGGTARLGAVPGYKVAGKTGTAWKSNPRGGYFRTRFVTSFVGMLPAENPAFVLTVVIDDPRRTDINRYGGTIAAPVFSRIAARAAARMNLPPTEPLKIAPGDQASRP